MFTNQCEPYLKNPIDIGHVIIHDGTEDSGEVPTHNITDDQNHRRVHTDDSDNTINKAALISQNIYLCSKYFVIQLPAGYDPHLASL